MHVAVVRDSALLRHELVFVSLREKESHNFCSRGSWRYLVSSKVHRTLQSCSEQETHFLFSVISHQVSKLVVLLSGERQSAYYGSLGCICWLCDELSDR